MTDYEDRTQVCAHGQPLGWACVSCRKDYGTAPAGPAAGTRRTAFIVCGHDPLYEEKLAAEKRYDSLVNALRQLRDDYAKFKDGWTWDEIEAFMGGALSVRGMDIDEILSVFRDETTFVLRPEYMVPPSSGD